MPTAQKLLMATALTPRTNPIAPGPIARLEHQILTPNLNSDYNARLKCQILMPVTPDDSARFHQVATSD